MRTIALGAVLLATCLEIATSAQQPKSAPASAVPLAQQRICAEAAQRFMKDWPSSNDRVEHESRFSRLRGICLAIVKVWFTDKGVEVFNSNVYDSLGRQRVALLISDGPSDTPSVVWFDDAGKAIERPSTPDDITKFNLLVAGR